LTPLIKLDISSPARIVQALEDLNRNPEAVIDLSKGSTSQEKAKLISLLTSAGGYHTLLNHANAKADETGFFKELLKFQKENPRGKSAKLQVDNADNVVSILRTDGDEHLILANFGEGPASYTFTPSAFNKTNVEAKGVVEMATSNAQQKSKDAFGGTIDLNRLSGVVIKLTKIEVTE